MTFRVGDKVIITQYIIDYPEDVPSWAQEGIKEKKHFTIVKISGNSQNESYLLDTDENDYFSAEELELAEIKSWKEVIQ